MTFDQAYEELWRTLQGSTRIRSTCAECGQVRWMALMIGVRYWSDEIEREQHHRMDMELAKLADQGRPSPVRKAPLPITTFHGGGDLHICMHHMFDESGVYARRRSSPSDLIPRVRTGLSWKGLNAFLRGRSTRGYPETEAVG